MDNLVGFSRGLYICTAGEMQIVADVVPDLMTALCRPESQFKAGTEQPLPSRPLHAVACQQRNADYCTASVAVGHCAASSSICMLVRRDVRCHCCAVPLLFTSSSPLVLAGALWCQQQHDVHVG